MVLVAKTKGKTIGLKGQTRLKLNADRINMITSE